MAWRNRLHKAAKSLQPSGKNVFDDSMEKSPLSSHRHSVVRVDSDEERRMSINLDMHKDSLQKNRQELEDILEDSPMTRESFRIREQELESIGGNIRKLIKLSKQFQAAGDAFRTISDTFGQELMRFDFSDLPSDLEQSFEQSAASLGETVINVGEYHSMFMVQLGSVFTDPLDKFLKTEVKEAKEIFKQHSRLRSKYDQSISKFSHVKKTEIEKIPEAEHELYYVRKEFQHSSLDYASKLRRVQTLSKIQLMECACAFITNQRAYFHQG